MKDSNFVKRTSVGLIFIVMASFGLKAGLLWAATIPFNADEAVVGLMARHILLGERPVFFYGQAYMGSLDAWLVAAGFRILGQQVWVIRLIQSFLYACTLLTTACLGKKIFNAKAGLLAAGLLAIPTVNVTLYTTVSLGGYGEALLIGNLILLVGISIAEKLDKHAVDVKGQLFLWGFLVGLGLWAFGLTLVYTLPSGIYLMWAALKRRKAFIGEGSRARSLTWSLMVSLGLVLGSTPWWSFAFRNGIQQLIWELSGGAIAGVEGLPYLLQVGQHATNLLILGSTVTLGFRPPWGVEWLGLPLLPFVFIVWMSVLLYSIRQLGRSNHRRPERYLLLGVAATLCIAFIFTPFGADPSGRYYLPLAIPLALFAAAMIVELVDTRGKWVWGIAGLLLIYNLWGHVQLAIKNPPGFTTQFNPITQIDTREFPDLINFLISAEETRGYTNYWVGYPLAFHSEEELIFVPRLPYHTDFRYTERDDRYLLYDTQVNQAEKVAYITTNHPDLDNYLRTGLTRLGIGWRENKIGDFQVFYSLTRPVTPYEMGLGRSSP